MSDPPAGCEEWVLLEEGVHAGDEPALVWHVEGARPAQRGDEVVLKDEQGVDRVAVRAPLAFTRVGMPIPLRLEARGGDVALVADPIADPVLIDPEWTPAGPMNTSRYLFRVTAPSCARQMDKVSAGRRGHGFEFESKYRSAVPPRPPYPLPMTRQGHRKETRGMPANAKSQAIAAAVESDPRWASVRARDARADGKFFYSVRTTGVYCRPSCASRPARPENVAFHATRTEAERAGFRPCKRCKPDHPALSERQAAVVAELCRLIESSDEVLTLEDLARHAGLSVFHAHRMFKAATGVTPRAYAAAHRRKRVRAELGKSATVTQAIYGAGYSSNGRFYEEANDLLGMTPTRYRAGGADTDIRFAIGECSLGSILVAASARGVCAILLGDDPEELAHDLERRFPRARLNGADPTFEELVAKVVGLIEKPRAGIDLPLDVRGTAFQQRVWEALRAIPAGATASYSDIANAIGAPKAVRAVAQACAANSLAVAIPCHRVVRTDGDPSGYRWGVKRKRALLAREASA